MTPYDDEEKTLCDICWCHQMTTDPKTGLPIELHDHVAEINADAGGCGCWCDCPDHGTDDDGKPT